MPGLYDLATGRRAANFERLAIRLAKRSAGRRNDWAGHVAMLPTVTTFEVALAFYDLLLPAVPAEIAAQLLGHRPTDGFKAECLVPSPRLSGHPQIPRTSPSPSRIRRQRRTDDLPALFWATARSSRSMPNSWCSASIRRLRREQNSPRSGESLRRSGKHHEVSVKLHALNAAVGRAGCEISRTSIRSAHEKLALPAPEQPQVGSHGDLGRRGVPLPSMR
jgi:hypothetical protein